jgi:hypothetical protein
MRLNPDAVEKLNELAAKESANQASGETQEKRNSKASVSQQQKKRGRSKSYTSPTPKTKKTKKTKRLEHSYFNSNILWNNAVINY